jgi:hypothetical protein
VAYALLDNDIVEVSYRSALTIMAAGGGVRDSLTSAVCPQMVMREERAQVVYPGRQYYHSNGVNIAGTFAGTCVTANVAGVIVKRPSHAGRGRTGAVHLAGMDATTMSAGTIGLLQLAAMNTLATQLRVIQAPGGVLGSFEPVIWSRRLPGTPSAIVTTFIDPEVRTMHRRTLGLGI